MVKGVRKRIQVLHRRRCRDGNGRMYSDAQKKYAEAMWIQSSNPPRIISTYQIMNNPFHGLQVERVFCCCGNDFFERYLCSARWKDLKIVRCVGRRSEAEFPKSRFWNMLEWARDSHIWILELFFMFLSLRWYNMSLIMKLQNCVVPTKKWSPSIA